MADLVLSGNTSGAITISAPSVAGTNTITLPANTGTVITTASSGQSIPKAALPTGSVLQVVNATYSTETSTNSTSYTDTGLSASITPTSSTSKILVLVDQTDCWSDANATSGMGLRLLRGSTTLIDFAKRAGYHSSGDLDIGTISAGYLDSPATTSSITYKTQFARVSLGIVYVQVASGTSTITLMEISA